MYHSSVCGSTRKVKEGAEKRAAFLKKTLVADEGESDSETSEIELIKNLVRDACIRIGKTKVDVTPFAQKLEMDWYDDVESLKGTNIDTLRQYMPGRLAEAVHKMLQEMDDS